MTEPKMDDDAQRWADAQSVVDGWPTATARRRGAYAVLVPICVGGLLVIVFASVVALSVHDHFDVRIATTSAARVLGWVIAGLGALASLGGAIWSRRQRRSRPPRSPLSPLASLTRRQRGELRRAIRRDQAVSADRRDVVAYQADELAHPLPSLLALAGPLMIVWGEALGDNGVVPVWLSALTVLLLGCVVPAVWDCYRARVWLAAHEGRNLHRFN